jgi:hypothetical protein
MRTVFEYDLLLNNVACFDIPKGGEVLTAQFCRANEDRLSLWVKVDLVDREYLEFDHRFFMVVGTAKNCPTNGNYIGTAQTSKGMAWHVFECSAEEFRQFFDDNDEDDDDYVEPDDNMSDVEADAATLASCGWGTDEDYGYFGDDYD